MREKGLVRKFASDLGLGGDIRRVLRFPPPITTGLTQLQFRRKDGDYQNKTIQYFGLDLLL